MNKINIYKLRGKLQNKRCFVLVKNINSLIITCLFYNQEKSCTNYFLMT